VATKGALAGLAGTLVLTLALQNAHRVLPSGREADPAASTDEPTGDPTERLADKVAGVFETELSPDARQTLAMGIHWGYGAFWGMAYGVIQSSLHLPGWLHGSLLGLLVWMIGPMGLIPAMKLARPSPDVPPVRRLVSVVLHGLYGWTTAAAFHLLSRDA
jgi:hypothetical protein